MLGIVVPYRDGEGLLLTKENTKQATQIRGHDAADARAVIRGTNFAISSHFTTKTFKSHNMGPLEPRSVI